VTWRGIQKNRSFDKWEEDSARKIVSALFATSLGKGASVFSRWAGNQILFR
jgi:hypothetical protein